MDGEAMSTIKVGEKMRWVHTYEISYPVTIKEIKKDWVVVKFDYPFLGESNVHSEDLKPVKP
jgi:hypothetical protein